MRSCFYPLLKDSINDKAGDVIDIMALLATLFGIIITLGFGASQLGTCLYQMGWVSENSFSLQIIVIAVVTSLAVFFDQDEPAVELVIQKESMRDFMYGIKSVGREVSEQLINNENLPHIQHSTNYEPYTYFFDGRVGYDVQYMDQDELIADILKHYERYLSLLDDVGQELMSHEKVELAE